MYETALISDIESVDIIDRKEEAEKIRLLSGAKPFSMLIYGESGSGKTLLAKRIFTNSVYVNCSSSTISLTEIYRNILSSLFREYITVSGFDSVVLKRHFKDFFDISWRGYSNNDYERFIQEIIETKQTGGVTIILDEISRLVEKHGEIILYQLFDLNGFRRLGISTVAITNKSDFFNNIKAPEIRQRVLPMSICFQPYTAPQIHEMVIYYLKLIGETRHSDSDVATFAYHIANITKSAREVKLFMYHMFNAYKTINIENIPEVQKQVEIDTKALSIKNISIYEIITMKSILSIHEAIKTRSDIIPDSETIYQKYKEIVGQKETAKGEFKNKSYYTFQRYLRNLAEKQIIEIRKQSYGKSSGVKNLIYPEIDLNHLRKLISQYEYDTREEE